MRILLLSDVHTEFHADKGRAFFESFAKFDDYDVAVLAGDISDFTGMPAALEYAADNLKRAVYVIGNHEAYGGSINTALRRAATECERHGNLTHLEASSVIIDGVKFVGATMWFPELPDNCLYEHYLNDFTLIRDFRDKVYKQNDCTRAYLNGAVEPGCVVITHHLPCRQAVHPKWRRSVLNRFFVCDQEQLIREEKPALWCFGHTHESVYEVIGETRLVANPFGYVGHGINPHFVERKVVET